MSSPDTNISRQARRHKSPLIEFGLIGIAVALVFVIYNARDVQPNGGAADIAPAAATVTD